MTEDDSIIDAILAREGSKFTNYPKDRGGPTKFGITRLTLSLWRGGLSSADDVEALEETEARELYRCLYLERPGLCRILDFRLRELAVDCAVQHGPRRTIGWLQTITGVRSDGVWGPITEEAVNKRCLLLSASELYKKLLARRIRFYGEIISRDPSQAVFAKGWMSRVAWFLENDDA